MRKIISITLVVISILAISTLTISAESVQNGEWLVDADNDPLTDEFTLIIVNQKDYNNALYLRRQGGKTELILGTEYLGTAGYDPSYSDLFKDLLYRFDEEELIETEWSISSDGSALFFKEDQDTMKSFVKKMMEHENLVFGYWPYEKSRKTVEYSLEGFRESIEPYLDELGWEDLDE